jgi:hypothetical protein
MNLISTFLCLQCQLRVWHWQTTSYAEHKALGKLYESLDSLVDDFVETFSGSAGGVPKAKEAFRTECINHPGTDGIMSWMDEKIAWLNNEVPAQVGESRSDLLNIRDEMVAAINKTKYLLRLK